MIWALSAYTSFLVGEALVTRAELGIGEVDDPFELMLGTITKPEGVPDGRAIHDTECE